MRSVLIVCLMLSVMLIIGCSGFRYGVQKDNPVTQVEVKKDTAKKIEAYIPVFCPECKKLGKKSNVYFTGIVKTNIVWTPLWFDSLGVRHIERDPNHEVYQFQCSNGHKFNVD
jgi:hypothetical protein